MVTNDRKAPPLQEPPPLFSETDSGDIQDLAQMGRRPPPGGGGSNRLDLRGFNPDIFSPAALLEPFTDLGSI